MKNLQRNFIFPLLLIIGLVIVLAGAYFYSKNRQNGSFDGGSIDVTELGIRILLPKNVEDFKYVVKNGVFYFSRASLEAISPYCKTEGGPFGVLFVMGKSKIVNDPYGYWKGFTKADIESRLSQGLKDGNVKDLGDSYLILETPQDASCAIAARNAGATQIPGFDLRDLVRNATEL